MTKANQQLKAYQRYLNFMRRQVANSNLMKPIPREIRTMFQRGLPHGWGK